MTAISGWPSRFGRREPQRAANETGSLYPRGCASYDEFAWDPDGRGRDQGTGESAGSQLADV